MRAPIKYYGGKANMLSYILPMIPEHNGYGEFFLGGGSTFWEKEPSQMEVLNDVNGNVTNFYEVMKTNFEALWKRVISTLHCEYTHSRARKIFFNPGEVDSVERAWAFWVLCNMSFGSNIKNGGFQWTRNKSDSWHPAITIRNKRNRFHQYIKRLENVTIRNRKAEELIPMYDAEDFFFYLDPPYVGARQAHYSGYTQQDFDDLLEALSGAKGKGIKGKFLLSSYPNENLSKMVKKMGWNQLVITQRLGVASNGVKQEVLTWNYDLEEQKKELTLFS